MYNSERQTDRERKRESEREQEEKERQGHRERESFGAFSEAALDRPSITKYPPSLRGGGGGPRVRLKKIEQI